MAPGLSLRERNRLATMRLVQATAVEMFEADGFTATAVEAVAAEAGVSPSTIYRLFGTKEALITWDERDSVIEAELTERLGHQPPIAAFRDAMRIALSERTDLDLFARRLRLMYNDVSAGAAAVEQDLHDHADLAQGFAMAEGRNTPDLIDDVLAGASLAAVDAALDHWQRGPADDAATLAALIDQAFAPLTDIAPS